MRSVVFILFFFFTVSPSIGQQIHLENIDIRVTTIDDTLTVSQYLDIMNQESTFHHIKSKTTLEKRKYLKNKIKSKEFFNPNGKIKFKVDYEWKGGDSCRVYYEYDTNQRLVKAYSYYSIFGKDDEGRFIKIEYDKFGKVLKCETKYKITSFGYNSNGSKKWVEFINYDYFFTKKRQNETYLANSDTVKYFYLYTTFSKLSCIVNSKQDTLVKFNYDELHQLIEKNSFNTWSNRYRFKDGRIYEQDFLDHDNSEQDTILNETCQYIYKNDVLIKMNCTGFFGEVDNTNYEYIYNEKGLLSEVIRKNKKDKLVNHTIFLYEFY